MSLSLINCPYCSAENALSTVNRTTTDAITLKIITHEETNTVLIPSYHVKCCLCSIEYDFIKVSKYTWIKNQLKPTNTMVDTFKIKFPNSTPDLIYNNIVGVTRPKNTSISDRLFRHKHLHVCFELEGNRAYIDCLQTKALGKPILQGLDIYAV